MEVQIEFFLKEVPFNNKMPILYHGLCAEFSYLIKPWLFCATVDGFNQGKITSLSTIDPKCIDKEIESMIEVDDYEKKVTLRFNIGYSRPELLCSMFKLFNYMFYLFSTYNTTFKNRFDVFAERVIKIDKVIISDLEVIS
ncbi:MAG: hypothetical protein RBT49_16015 [Bacteroidales bacterium]|nr:hypothetical protein [Bacteroidales bacterium]